MVPTSTFPLSLLPPTYVDDSSLTSSYRKRYTPLTGELLLALRAQPPTGQSPPSLPPHFPLMSPIYGIGSAAAIGK